MSYFRSQIVNRDRKCIVSSVSEVECDAAHIIPYSVCSEYFESGSINPSNGLLLTKSLHSLFDQHIWTFDIMRELPSDTKTKYLNLPVIISPKYKNHRTTVHPYNNRTCRIPVSSYPFLYVHYQIFISKLANSYCDQSYAQILKTDTTWTALISGQKPDLKPRKTAIAICDHKHMKEIPHYLVWYQNHHFDQLTWVAEEDLPDQLVEKYLENQEKTDDSDYDV